MVILLEFWHTIKMIDAKVLSLIANLRYREAFVCLWNVLQKVGAVNNAALGFSQISISLRVAEAKKHLDDEQLPTNGNNLNPLVWILALEAFLWETKSAFTNARPEMYRVEFEAAAYWLLPVLQKGPNQVALARQTSNLRAWVKHFSVVNCELHSGVKVELYIVAGKEGRRWESLAARENLKAYLGHFDDGADVAYQIDNDGKRWLTLNVAPQLHRNASLLEVMKQSAINEDHIVVLPEFTVDLAGRETLQTWLLLNRDDPCTPLLTVAGSFHEEISPGCFFNTAPVLNGRGSPYFAHEKLRLQGTIDELTENALEGSKVHLLLTPIGTHTVLICKDFLDRAAMVDTLLQSVPVDWVWVPSYGHEGTLKEHLSRADEIARKTVGANVGVAQTENTALAKISNLPPPAKVLGFGWRSFANQSVSVPIGGGTITFPLKPTL
jgi:hypothetical protein